MEIEFNTNKVGKPDPEQPVARQAAVRQAQADPTFLRAEALEAQLRSLPESRPEVVERARTLVADIQYPPEQVLRSLAHLLALKLR